MATRHEEVTLNIQNEDEDLNDCNSCIGKAMHYICQPLTGVICLICLFIATLFLANSVIAPQTAHAFLSRQYLETETPVSDIIVTLNSSKLPYTSFEVPTFSPLKQNIIGENLFDQTKYDGMKTDECSNVMTNNTKPIQQGNMTSPGTSSTTSYGNKADTTTNKSFKSDMIKIAFQRALFKNRYPGTNSSEDKPSKYNPTTVKLPNGRVLREDFDFLRSLTKTQLKKLQIDGKLLDELIAHAVPDNSTKDYYD